MPRFESGIFGMVAKKDLLQIGYDVTRPNDPVDQLFDDDKTENLIAEWESLAAEYNIPVMAQFHAFDTEAQKTLRVPIDVRNIEKGLIKVKIDQSERLRALMGRGVTGETALYNKVLNDAYNLAEEVFTRSKVAKNEILATGKMTIKENNLDLTVDYGVPAGHVNKTLDFGAGADKPLDEQLTDLIGEARDNGAPITGIYTSETMLTKLRKSAVLQAVINGSNMVGKMIRQADLEAYLKDELKITRVLTNDLIYSLPLTMGANNRPVVTKKRYYPDNKITFFSANDKLGRGLWGDPPEVSASKYMEVEESEVSPYVFVSQYAENDPAVTWTKASGLFMPVLFSPDSLYIATATATPGIGG